VRVDLIDTAAAFDALEQDWNVVQGVDPDAGYFLSWRWLAEVFRAHPGKWGVLAVRPEPQPVGYVCFLPLRLRVRWSRGRREFGTEFEAGGRLSWAQYTGFLCLPGWEEKALAALAAELQKIPWSYFRMTNWLTSERRRELFLSGFEQDKYELSFDHRALAEGDVDNRVCPFVPLPDRFEDYLSKCVSSNTRQKIRRFSRRIERAVDLKVTVTGGDLFQKHLGLILDLWLSKWAAVRGQRTAEKVVRKYREILAQSMACDAVFMPILWAGDAPLGGLAHIVDRHKRQMHFIVAGRNQDASDPFIGLILHAYSIRWAIENKLKVYDFCHGNEPYKYSLGATEKKLDHLVIRRRSRAKIGRLDPRNMSDALDEMSRFLAAGRIDETNSACRQLGALCRSLNVPERTR
jgi:Acetyltransferase (GNAT) domain